MALTANAVDLDNDRRHMRAALREAEAALVVDEVPVGAVAVAGDRIIARGHNLREQKQNPVAHAEMEVITRAAHTLGTWRLNDVTLYVTLEPCAMCAGAMVNCRLGKVVFGAPDPRSGGAGGALDITGFPGMLHQVEVTSGVLQAECLGLIQSFFQERRRQAKES